MLVFGIDAHKKTHTIVAIDITGKKLAEKVVDATTAGHEEIVTWIRTFDDECKIGVEDCRSVTRLLEADLRRLGYCPHRVPPKMTASTRKTQRTFGKSDPIDALCIAKALQANPDLPLATPDEQYVEELRVLCDYRDSLVRENTRKINQIRDNFHQFSPGYCDGFASTPSLKTLAKWKTETQNRDHLRAHVTSLLIDEAISLTTRTNALSLQIRDTLAKTPGQALTTICGISHLGAARIVGDIGSISRFNSRDSFAKFNGTAPIPVWSSNNPRVRLNRFGNRKINSVIHMASISQSRKPQAQEFLARRKAMGNTSKEARRSHKRQLSNVIYRVLLDAERRHQGVVLPIAA